MVYIWPLLTFSRDWFFDLFLLSMHVTTAAAERNWSSWDNTYNAGRSQLNVATAEKMVYIKANIPSSEPSEPSQLLAEGITT
ncbi:hypothetical protein QJQ45_011346 [Haematococcus lacustris]|nr:hypothetical protein QJQ45_011346 [Haematococcus lacustris]